MADNIELNSGSGGASVKTDDDGSAHWQYVKAAFGPDNTQTRVTATEGLPIQGDGTDLPITLDGEAVVLGAGSASIGTLGANSGVDIGDVDIISVTPGTGASNLGKAEDAAHSTGDVGVMALAVRQDTQSDFGADGDYVPFSIDANGALRVSGGGGGTEYNEDDATPATIVGTATLMERDDALSTVTPVEGDWIAFRGTAEGALWVQDFNSDAILADTANIDTNVGTIAGAVSGSEMQVDVVAALPAGTNNIGDVDVLSVVPGTGATNLGKAEDAAHSTGDTGVLALAVRRAADTPTSGTDGDYEPLKTDANGHLKVEIFDGGDSHTIDGTVTAELSAVDNAVLDTIETNTDFGTVTGGGTETGALRVTLANNSTGVVSVDDNGGALTVDNGGTFVVQEDGDALTALQLIDDVVHTDDAAFTLGTSKGVMMMGFAGTQSVNANDAAALACDTDGALHIADGGNSLTVDASELTTLAGAVSGSEMQVDVVAALPAGSNAIGKLAANSGVDIGDVDVTSISAGSNLIGDVGISGARTSGGTTIFRSLDLDESEEEVKGSAGQVYWIHAMNQASAKRYLKFYNATAATVEVGTTTPVLTFVLPTQGDTNGAGFVLSIPNGIAFGTAITVAATTGIADNDTGAPSANDVVVNIGYA